MGCGDLVLQFSQDMWLCLLCVLWARSSEPVCRDDLEIAGEKC